MIFQDNPSSHNHSAYPILNFQNFKIQIMVLVFYFLWEFFLITIKDAIFIIQNYIFQMQQKLHAAFIRLHLKRITMISIYREYEISS